MTDLSNIEAWAMTQGYDPNTDYTDGTSWPDGYLSEHFHEGEFKCNCCGRLHPDGVPQDLLDILENIRAHFGKPININSGYRCPSHNAAVGGASQSQHMKGTAADIWIEGVDPSIVYAYADALVGDGGGVGKYNTFTHVDVRGHHARW